MSSESADGEPPVMDKPIRTPEDVVTAQIAGPGLRALERDGEVSIWGVLGGERVGVKLIADETARNDSKEEP